ncbi:mechanosensitive ion channel domain-containing protein [Mastigocoleus testarum]|uniref:Mechanosensitive ion channel protein MscS n=1 Tax=Mastigocoleus testarum BC008 TaxID=371196 RepID=A0A0V7ZNH7_9CYAN|nr:mechanosensitive ion channel domain-containing protein [Mastigocoleus testarum]KST65930.1 mechanosensitive ion channel protein MscS [Mastigocoleus testarum BC008]
MDININMDVVNQVLEFLQRKDIRDLEIFFVCIVASLVIGRYTPSILKLIIRRFFPKRVKEIYDEVIYPVNNLLRLTATIILISSSLEIIKNYGPIYNILRGLADIAAIFSFAWLASRFCRQLLRVYGIEIIRKLGYSADDLLLVLETIINVSIGFIAVLAYAKDRFDLVGLFTGLGIGGIALGLAATKTLEQLIGTLVLYLDRPFIPGEYIRLPPSSEFLEEIYGRVESIGLRSTKIRTAAKSTLFIIPNSILARLEIENITRGKKVMVLLYLDFDKKLGEKEEALVEQIIAESTNSLFGIDPGSTNIAIIEHAKTLNSRARITFFILGSSESSIQLRKRLLELANEKVSRKLTNYGIAFDLQEPNIYVESPVTI